MSIVIFISAHAGPTTPMRNAATRPGAYSKLLGDASSRVAQYAKYAVWLDFKQNCELYRRAYGTCSCVPVNSHELPSHHVTPRSSPFHLPKRQHSDKKITRMHHSRVKGEKFSIPSASRRCGPSVSSPFHARSIVHRQYLFLEQCSESVSTNINRTVESVQTQCDRSRLRQATYTHQPPHTDTKTSRLFLGFFSHTSHVKCTNRIHARTRLLPFFPPRNWQPTKNKSSDSKIRM